jgi:hypothetical protein
MFTKYGHSENVKILLPQFLPFAFMGRYDDDERVSQLWKDLWSENTSSLESGIIMFTAELVKASIIMMSSQHWILKRNAAQALGEIIKAKKRDISSYVPEILSTLVDLIPGFIWDGKGEVLQALAELSKFSFIPVEKTIGSPCVLPDMLALLLTEVVKPNSEYQRQCMSAIATITSHQKHYNAYKQIR